MVRRQPVIFRPDKMFEEKPGHAGQIAQFLSLTIRYLFLVMAR
jgi:hypothetical protein